MKLKLLFIGFLGVVFTTMTYAQYTTPDTGVNWT